MEDKYFKNRNNKKSYTLEELINSGPIFNDDLIWKKGLSDWTKAINIDELEEHVLERPPERNSRIILRRIKQSLLPSFIILVSVSAIVGITAGLLEKHQYNDFIEKVEPNIDEYFKKKQEQAELKRKRELERKRKKEQIEQSLINLRSNFEKRDKELEILQNEAYNNYLNSTHSFDVDFYISVANGYLDKRNKLLKEYNSNKQLLEYSMPEEPINSSSISLVTYDIPVNTIYAFDDNGESYTRWAVYKGVGNHEQLSYDKSHKFLFRPYKAYFSAVNISENERENTFVLLWNFFLSALTTNLLFFPLIVLGVMRYKKV